MGKTTTAINLGAALAQLGISTLLVDLDPQGNASTGLGVRRRDRGQGTYALLENASACCDAQQATPIAGLTLLAADPDLAGAEIELVSLERREFRLRDGLRLCRSKSGPCQVVLIDCPPSLGLLTLNGLVAADAVLVPLQCEFFALEGVGHLVQTVERVRRRLNPALSMMGIVLTMYDRRNNLSDLVMADARAFFGPAVFDTVIPRNVKLSEAPSHGQSVLTYDPKSTGALAYQALAQEFRRRQLLA